MQRLWLFLYSTRNIAGSLLGLIGLVLYFLGLIKSYWLFIVAGLYALGYLGVPRQRSRLEFRVQEEANLEEALDELLGRLRRKRAAPDVIVRIETLRESILAMLPHFDRLESAAYQAHVIRQTVLSYLPEMLERYLDLPPAYARLHVLEGGKTARDLVLEQLDLLDAEMKKILVDMLRDDAAALMAHGRFLREKFGDTRADWL